MPPRPVIKVRQNRPVSAIYLGKGGGGIGGPSPSLQDLSQSASGYASLISATPPNLPDLPEPELVDTRDEVEDDGRSSPYSGSGLGRGRGSDFEFEEREREREREMMESPSPTPVSRRGGSVLKPGSGLPSPPATNSTGSGSTGDPATIRGESKTISRPLSLHSNSSNGASTSAEGYHRQQHQQHMRRGTSSSINLGSMVSGNGNNGRLQDVELDDGGDAGVEGDYDDDYDKEDEMQRERREFDEHNDDDDDKADNESNVDDGDNTARMDRRFLDRQQDRSSTENVLALQRVKNLAQRNRMALDKLSRLSPSPARTGIGSVNLGSSISSSRSPAPPAPPSTSSSSSSRLAIANANNSMHTPSRLSQTQIQRIPSTTSSSSQQSDLHIHDLARSGSETERESTRHSYSSSHSSSSHSHSNHYRSASHHQSSGSVHHSPTLSLSQLTLASPSPSQHATLPPPSTPHRSPYHRVRHISAPDSPEKVRVGNRIGMSLANEAGGSTSSLTRSPGMGRRRNRMSLASMSQLALSDQEEEREDGEGDVHADEQGRIRRRVHVGGEEEDPGLRTATTTGTARRDRTLNERDMIIQSALAAAAASGGGAGGTRRSPLSARRRGALPREFRSQSQAGMVSSSAAGMQGEDERTSPSPSPGTRRRDSWRTTEPMTPLRPQTTGQGRSATLRESTTSSVSRRRSGVQDPRWSSEDLRSSTLRERDRTTYSVDRNNTNSSSNRASYQNDRTYNTSHSTEEHRLSPALTRTERRQSLRGGSAESALLTWSPGGRSLLGEGLRAAGLRPKRESEDLRGVVIPGVGGAAGKEPGSTGGLDRDGSERDRNMEQRRATGEWSPQDVLDAGRRRVFEKERQPARASTSMAQYQYLDREAEEDNHHRGKELRSHKSAYYLSSRDLERDSSVTRNVTTHERAASALGGYHHNTVTSPTPLHTTTGATAHVLDRMAASSPFTASTRRYSSNTAAPGTANNNNLNASTASTINNSNIMANMSASQIQLEHTRLMLESLSMFESQVVKLPQLATSSTKSTSSTGASQVELARNAQGVVFAAERLSGMLRHGGMRALEAQVEAEVEGSSSAVENRDGLVEVFGRVVTEYRDGSRVADELVRGITALLLGVGRVMRDFGAAAGDLGTQSPSVHNRHLSLDYLQAETGGAPGQGASSTESGRHSVASRRSWEPTPRDKEREREETFKRLAGTRPESVLARASPATFQKLKDREERERASPVNAHKLNASLSGPRRLFTPREKREQILDAARAEVIRGGANLVPADSQETIHQRLIEPSPTPATRVQVKASPRERSRTLTPLSIPKPLPALPSESTNRRQATTSTNPPATAGLEKSTGGTIGTGSTRERARRSTLRSSFPLITSPSNATTAITPHTVSNTPSRSLFPLPRTNSDRSEGPSPGVTFSKPTPGSISATLSDLHQQVERQRSTGGSSASASNSISTGEFNSNNLQPPPTGANLSRSTSDVERDPSSREARRKTLGGVSRAGMPRSSLDSATPSRAVLNSSKSNSATVHAADRSAATTILQQGTPSTRERRRTVTEIWPQK